MDLDQLIEKLQALRANNPINGRLSVVRETKKRNNKKIVDAKLHIVNGGYFSEDCVILKFE